MLFGRNTYRTKKTSAIAMALVVMMSMLAMGAITDNDTKKVVLTLKDSFNDIENTREVITRKITVEEFLLEQGVTFDEGEIINAELTDIVLAGANIAVEKSKMVEVHADGGIKFERATEKTVGEALYALGYQFTEDDVVTPDIETEIVENMVITLDKFVVEEIINEIEIPYNAITEEDNTKYIGEKAVKQYGVPGKLQETVKVTKKNGEEISREVLSTVTVCEPQDEIVVCGTKQKEEVKKAATAKSKSTAKADKKEEKPAKKENKPAAEEKKAAQKSEPAKETAAESTSSSNKSSKGFSYSKVLTMNATAYDPSPSTNAGHAKTAYGLTPEYGVVAVDPKVIPLGTKLYIESSDGGASWVYGYCIAGDTGGAIKGNKIDLCFNTKAECMQFGRKSATVYILN